MPWARFAGIGRSGSVVGSHYATPRPITGASLAEAYTLPPSGALPQRRSGAISARRRWAILHFRNTIEIWAGQHGPNRTGGSNGTRVLGGRVGHRPGGGSAGDNRRGAEIRRHIDLHDPGGLDAEF